MTDDIDPDRRRLYDMHLHRLNKAIFDARRTAEGDSRPMGLTEDDLDRRNADGFAPTDRMGLADEATDSEPIPDAPEEGDTLASLLLAAVVVCIVFAVGAAFYLHLVGRF